MGKGGTRIDVEGDKWFEKPRSNQSSLRGEGRVGFLVHECFVNEVEFINSAKYEECVDEGNYIVRGEGKHCK